MASVVHLQQTNNITLPITSEPLIPATEDSATANASRLFKDSLPDIVSWSDSMSELANLLADGDATANMMSVGDQHGMAMSYVHLCT